MREEQVIETLTTIKALLKGHFQLSSGLHSDTYIQCAKVFEHPDIAQNFCRELASFWSSKKIDVVAGPAYGGIIASYELARQLNCRSIFLERVDGKLTLRREFGIAKGDRVLMAEDVVTTGGSVKEAIEVVKQCGGEVVGITSLINRSVANPFKEELHCLMSIIPPTFKQENCPLCKDGLPMTKPGSRGLL